LIQTLKFLMKFYLLILLIIMAYLI